MKHLILSAFILAGLLSCNNSNKEEVSHKNTSSFYYSGYNDKDALCGSCINRTIYIQPYEGFNKADLAYLETELKRYYKKVAVKEDKKLPKSFYVKERNRFRADSIIAYQQKQVKEKDITILGVTSYDISLSYKGHKDWGVMGLGYLPGNSCVVSTFRLDKKKKREQLVKTAVHEIGHTLGLPHCPNEGCLMQDAKGKNKWNKRKQFCESCSKVLRRVYSII